MKTYNCKTANTGFAAGNLFVYRKNDLSEYIKGTPEKEQSALIKATDKMKTILAKFSSGQNIKKKELADAEMTILENDLKQDALKLVRERIVSAPDAIRIACEGLTGKLQKSDSEYIRERSTDIRGLADRLIGIIEGKEITFPDTPFILAAEELSPGLLASVNSELLLGMVSNIGSVSSHATVLAKDMGIPYLYGVQQIGELTESNTYAIMDSEENVLLIDPDEEQIKKAKERLQEMEQARQKEEQELILKKTDTCIYANISGPEAIPTLQRVYAQGVGLFRSEFLFLNGNNPPTEDEQYEAYREVAEAMGDREVVIRTMDIGSDKKTGWLKLDEEKNPALGMRGLRVSLENPELFQTQLKALLRAAVHGNLKIMLPMVVSEWEVDEALKCVRQAATELEKEGLAYRIPQMGVMIETPASVIIADKLAKKVKFFSIGTNDLAQYTLAIDRESKGLDRYYDATHEAIMRMISETVKVAHANNIPVCVCGELASMPAAVEKLIRCGVDKLSVAVSQLVKVKKAVLNAEEKIALEKESRNIHAPADGIFIPMEEIPDEMFSKGMMGECIGIDTEDGKVYAPCDGVITTVAKTRHAFGIRSAAGEEFLVHVGIDTVNLNGEGFSIYIKEGDRVSRGQLVMSEDVELIRKKGFASIVIIAKLNG